MRNMITRTLLTLLLLGLLLPLNRPASAADEGPFVPAGQWTDEFKPAGPNGNVYAMVRDPRSGDLYVGGTFSLPAQNIARWDGAQWHALGSGIDWTVSTVLALAIDSQGNLYAAGKFEYAGGQSVGNIARWDGAQWHPLGSPYMYGLYGTVNALAIDAQDRLYVGGNITQAGSVVVSNLAMWDGAWHAVGSAYFNNYIYALAVDSRGALYVGGTFTSSSVPSSYGVGLAKWDGAQWSALGGGLSTSSIYNKPAVYSLVMGPGDTLYVGGYFEKAGGLASQHAAVWKDGAWSALGAGVPVTGGVNRLALAPDGRLYATVSGSMKLHHWDGAAWTNNGSTEQNWIESMLVEPDGALLIGGLFTTVSGVAAPRLARLQGGAWSPVGSASTAPNGAVEDLAWIGGQLYAAGSFTAAGTVAGTRGVAVWDGSAWASVGGGLNGTATCLEPDGTGGFYVGGVFTQAGMLSANRIAHWTGSTWQALGSGVSTPSVNDLAIGPDGNLYAVGSFTTAGGSPANRVARWDGARWYPLGSGLNDDAYVYALAFDPAGNLYVGGTFVGAGTVATSRVARWDGSTWSALGSGVNSEVWDLLYNPTDNSIYASGQFTQAGGLATAPVARWSISEQKWYATQSADMQLGAYVRLTLDAQNRLMVNNSRKLSVSQSVYDLAWLNGSTWQWLGANFPGGNIRTPVLFRSPNEFYVGGSFNGVNSTISPNLAHWQRPGAAAQDFSLPGVEDTPLALHTQDFNDHFLSPAGLAQVRFSLLPDSGTLRLGAQPVTMDQAIPLAALDQLVFAPAADFNGPVRLDWVGISADGDASPAAALTLDFAPVNDPPVAVDDSYDAEEDGPALTLDVLANDSDVDGPQLLIFGFDWLPRGGSVTITADNRLRYTPNKDFAGDDTFTYLIHDSPASTVYARAQVTVKVKPVNDPPVAVDDFLSVQEDTPQEIDARSNDHDIDSGMIVVSALTQPQHGVVTLTAQGNLRYSPAPDYFGPDSFTYTVSDLADPPGTASARVAVSVAAVNDAPRAGDDTYFVQEDTPVSLDVLLNDRDVDGPGGLIITAVGQPQHGTVTLLPAGGLRYTPTLDYRGPDSFTYTVSDLAEPPGTATGQVSITVLDENDAPQARNDTVETQEDQPLVIDVLANDADVDGPALHITAAQDPQHGQVTLTADGRLRYTPDPDYAGPDSFSYSVEDGFTPPASATARVDITVIAVNDAPSAADDQVLLTGAAPVIIRPLANDQDIDSATLTLIALSRPQHGAVRITGADTVEYIPDPAYSGTDAFTYTISDGQGGTAQAAIRITIEPCHVFLPLLGKGER